MPVERIAALECFQAPVQIESLAGGITNRNFLVRDGRGAYVARVCQKGEHLGIDRRNELVCHRSAAAAGIAPEVLHAADGIVVTPFVAGRTLSADDVKDHDTIARLAERLRTLHDGWDRLSGEILYFCPFQTIRTYTDTARRLGAALPDDIERLLDDSRGLAHRLRPFRPTLCHNDLLPANLIDDGEQIWFVDWEYGGMGHPLFDLAGAAGNCSLDDAQERHLLACYHGEYDAADHRELRTLKTVSLLREALWAVIQTVASELDFDYTQYAEANFAAYMRARRELD